MRQSEHIEKLLKRSKKQSELVGKIQQAYENYLESNSDKDFENLELLLDTYCRSWVRKKLWELGCYSDENEHTALQEAKIAIWQDVWKARASATKREVFAFFAFKVYKNKTWDIVRNILKKRANMDICSMEETIGQDGKNIEETIAAPDSETVDEKRWIFDKLFQIYCRGFMTAEVFPPRALALYYARVLPHLLCVISDRKTASAKWAFETMGNRTMWELKEDSENELKKKVDASLCWCEGFIHQMNEKLNIGNVSCVLKDVVYTVVYSKGKIEDWANSMHKTTVKAVMHLLPQNKELMNQIEEYISEGDVLFRPLREGKST